MTKIIGKQVRKTDTYEVQVKKKLALPKCKCKKGAWALQDDVSNDKRAERRTVKIWTARKNGSGSN